MADEVKLVDAELLTTNIAQIAKACAKSDKQKALVGRILFMIEHMPTIEAEPDNGWISVKDNTPCYEEEVLCYTANGYITGYYDGEWCLDLEIGKVTHWQPLPEPPKGE